MRKRRICSRTDMTDQQARDQVNFSEFAAEIIKEVERDYGKKLSTNGWGRVMDIINDMIYDTRNNYDDSERQDRIENFIYEIYENDTGIKDIYMSKKITCSVNRSGMMYAIIKKDPVKVSIGGNDDEIVNAIMEMNKDDLEKLYNSVIRKYYKLTQERAYDAGRKSRMFEKSTPHMSERDLIDNLVYLVQEGAIVPTKKASNIKGGTTTMRKKRFSVKASNAAKKRKRVCASRNIRVYEGNDNYQNYVIVRDFNRGDDDTMIVDWDLSDDEVYDIADRVNTGRYNPDTDGVGEYGWTTWDDAVGAMNGVHEIKASTKMKRKRVCASHIVLDRETADYVKDFLRKNGIKFDSSGYGKNTYLSINANPDEIKMIDDYIDTLGDFPVDVDDYRDSISDVNSAKSLRGRKRVCAGIADWKNGEFSIVLDKDTAYDLKVFLRRHHIKYEPSGYGFRTHFYFQNLTQDEVNLINDYLDTIGEYPIDVEDYRDSLPAVNSAKSVRCARTMRKHVCASGSMRKSVKRFIKASIGDDVYADDIKDIIRKSGIKVYDVNKSRIHNSDSFFSILLDDTNDFNAVVDAIEGAGYGVSYDYPAVDGNYMYVIITDNREDDEFLYRVTYGYNSDVVPMDGETSDYQSILDALIDMKESRGDKDLYTYDEAESEGWYEDEYVSGGNHGLILYTGGNFDIKPIGWGKPSEVKSSKSIKGRKRVSASKRMRKSVKASFDPSSQYYKTLRVLRDNINMEFNDTIIGNAKIEVDDIKSGTSDACSFTIWIFDENGDYDKDTTIKIVSTEEAFANDTFLILVGMYKHGRNEYMEISRFGAKKIVADKINEIAENMSDGVTASTSIKCSDPIDSMFMVDLYYSPNHRGRAGDRYFYDWSEVEEYAHEALMNGLYVSIWNKENGDTLDISPEEYNDAWDNGAADFDINEDIVNFKRRIVESAKSIRCADEDAEIVEDDFTDDEDFYDVAYTDEDDTAELTVDISNLELGEPFYEMREDDPENPDKWVLVIGKNPEKQMNYKLWYYVDSTDADLTSLDLSNPDHIDIDEESTLADYDDIQLATKVSCKDDRYSADLVTM